MADLGGCGCTPLGVLQKNPGSTNFENSEDSRQHDYYYYQFLPCSYSSSEIAAFFNRPAKRNSILKPAVIDADVETNHQRLHNLCETRWVERHDAIISFKLLYGPTAPILSVFPALIVHSELKSVHPGFPVAFMLHVICINHHENTMPETAFLGAQNSTRIVVHWGFAPDPTGGAYSAPPDPIAGFKGP